MKDPIVINVETDGPIKTETKGELSPQQLEIIKDVSDWIKTGTDHIKIGTERLATLSGTMPDIVTGKESEKAMKQLKTRLEEFVEAYDKLAETKIGNY